MLRIAFLLTITTVNLYSLDIGSLINDAVKNSPLNRIETNSIMINKNSIELSKKIPPPKSLYLNNNIYGSLDGITSYSIGPKLTYEIFNTKNSNSIKRDSLEQQILVIKKNRKICDLFYYYYKLFVDIIYNQKLYDLNKEELKSREEYNKNIEERFKSKELSISEYTYSLSTILIYREDEKDSKQKLRDSIILFEAETGIDIDDYEHININLDSFGNSKEESTNEFDILKEISETDSSEKVNFRIDLNSGISYPLDSNSWNIGFNFYVDFPKSKKLILENKKATIESINYEQQEFIKNKKIKIDTVKSNISNSLEKLKVYESSIELLEKSLEGVIIESQNGEATSFDVILFQNKILELKKDVIRIEQEIDGYKLDKIYLQGGFVLNE